MRLTNQETQAMRLVELEFNPGVAWGAFHGMQGKLLRGFHDITAQHIQPYHPKLKRGFIPHVSKINPDFKETYDIHVTAPSRNQPNSDITRHTRERRMDIQLKRTYEGSRFVETHIYVKWPNFWIVLENYSAIFKERLLHCKIND